MTEKGNPVIRAEGIGFSYNGAPVLADVSFSILKKERLFVVGPNGAGKSTLIKLLARILTGAGHVHIEHRDIESYPTKELAKIVGYVPQASSFSAPFTVEEFVMMGRYPHLSPFTALTPADMEAVTGAMEKTGVTRFADRQVESLSGGEQQKVYIAAVIAQGASIMLLDEPTAFLDPLSCVDVMSLLARLVKQRGITLVQVTHDINQAAIFGDTILALKNGKTAYFGSATEFMTEEILEKVYGRKFTLTSHPVTAATIVAPDIEQ